MVKSVEKDWANSRAVENDKTDVTALARVISTSSQGDELDISAMGL